MIEYLLVSVYDRTKELIIWGYWYEDACRRYHCKPTDWIIIRADYVD